jgi:NAD-dependent SIR2 family protein deacetylase
MTATKFSFELLCDGLKHMQYRNIVVMSGAGISCSAGIPDFRSPSTGIYDNLKEYNLPYPEAIFELKYFRKNPEPYYKFCHHVRKKGARDVATPSHFFVRLLQDKTILHKYFTQNADGLETKTGMDLSDVVWAHGSTLEAHCSVCYSRACPIETNRALDVGVVKFCAACA